MPAQHKPILPLRLVALDAVGTIFVGLGLAKYFAEADIIPAALQFEHYGLFFIAGGAALMLPAIFHLLAKVRDKAPSQEL